MKKIISLVAVAIVTASALTGCTAEVPEEPPLDIDTAGSTVVVYPVKTSDGRYVDCAVLSGSYKGGLSCDWENAK